MDFFVRVTTCHYAAVSLQHEPESDFRRGKESESSKISVMETTKLVFKMVAFISGLAAVAALVIWILMQLAPLLIAAVVFIPWLFAALSDGAKV